MAFHTFSSLIVMCLLGKQAAASETSQPAAAEATAEVRFTTAALTTTGVCSAGCFRWSCNSSAD